MSINISGFGTIVNFHASSTYPEGISITQFSDDSDPIDSPSIQINNARMGLNGDLIFNSKANVIAVNFSIVSNSKDDSLLSYLFEANRPSIGKVLAYDQIQATIIQPDGSVFQLSDGVITDGMPLNSLTSDSGLKTKVYGFAFANITFA